LIVCIDDHHVRRIRSSSGIAGSRLDASDVEVVLTAESLSGNDDTRTRCVLPADAGYFTGELPGVAFSGE
jgi:hypothetical protein